MTEILPLIELALGVLYFCVAVWSYMVLTKLQITISEMAIDHAFLFDENEKRRKEIEELKKVVLAWPRPA
jgi:hypothetical protein